MYNADDSNLIIEERREHTRWEARKRMKAAFRKGRLPASEDIIQARGLIIAERENSILTQAWAPLALIFVLIGFISRRHPAWLTLGAVLIIILGVSIWWKNQSLIGVTYLREFDRTHAFPDEPIKMTTTILNQKWLPLTWLQIKDELPITPLEETSKIARLTGANNDSFTLQSAISISSFAQNKEDFTLLFPQRGFQKLGPVHYESGDIFTLYLRKRTHDYHDTLVIFPRIYTLAELGLPTKEPFGPLNLQQSLFTDPIKTRSIRDYQPGDRFRDVHWKATARRGQLQTKVYDPSTDMTLAIFLNVATMAKHWHGHFPELMERAVSVAGSLAHYGESQKWSIGLFANGSIPRSDQPIRVLPGRSPDQLRHVLEALAAVTEFATGSIERLMVRESPRLAWPATLLLVTAVLTKDMLVELGRLKMAGRRAAVIYLGEEVVNAGIHNIIIHHLTKELGEPIQPQATLSS